MADETDNLVLEHLRHIRAVVDGTRAEMKQFTMRMSVADQHIANLHVSEVGQTMEIDRIKERLQRIERRLELTEG
jgi:hypothetical protein